MRDNPNNRKEKSDNQYLHVARSTYSPQLTKKINKIPYNERKCKKRQGTKNENTKKRQHNKKEQLYTAINITLNRYGTVLGHLGFRGLSKKIHTTVMKRRRQARNKQHTTTVKETNETTKAIMVDSSLTTTKTAPAP